MFIQYSWTCKRKKRKSQTINQTFLPCYRFQVHVSVLTCLMARISTSTTQYWCHDFKLRFLEPMDISKYLFSPNKFEISKFTCSSFQYFFFYSYFFSLIQSLCQSTVQSKVVYLILQQQCQPTVHDKVLGQDLIIQHITCLLQSGLYTTL